MALFKNVFKRNWGRWIGATAVFSCVLCMAQSDEPTSSELLKESLELMEAEKYEEAVDTMYMYLAEVETSKLPRVVVVAQDIRFKLATALIKLDKLGDAADVLNEYIDGPIVNFRRLAMKMLASCLYESGSYEQCVEAVNNALAYDADPEGYLAANAPPASEEKDKDDDDFDEKKNTVIEMPYSTNDLVMLHVAQGESFYAMEKWEESIAPFTFVINQTESEQRKGYAIMQIVNALINIPDFDRITEWIPQLYRTTARFDIRVNLALMNAAAALYNANEYDSALPLFRMILPRDELVAYQENKLREMRIAAGLPPAMGEELTADEIAIFGGEDVSAEQTAATEVPLEMPKELVELEALIKTLKGLDPYENDISFRMAQLYKDVERYWEARTFYGNVYNIAPETEIGERAIFELIDILLEQLDEVDEAKQLALNYLSEHTEGMTPRMIAYTLTGYYQKHAEWPAVKELLPYLDTFVRTNDATIVQYDTELYYMQAVADLQTQKYEQSEKSFKRILEEFPDSHQEGNCLYWLGMSCLFQQKYSEAFPVFEQYVSKFPTGSWVDEALFKGGLCLFGLEKYAEAKERFSYVIANYPESAILPDACSMRGDIYGSEGKLDKAVVDYQMAIDNAKKVKQATYPVFQMAEVFEAEDNNEEKIVNAVEAYLDQWGAEADIAKALFWIGKTRISQGLIDEAVATYFGAIVEYGDDVRQDGVDLIIAELVKISSVWLETSAREQLIADLQDALDNTDNITLRLRLRVTVASLERTEIELGKQLIKELDTLEFASPPVLATLCDASFEMQDYSRAEELLEIFHLQFEDSEYMRAAYKLLGFARYEAKDYEGALKTIEEAQDLYGTDRDVAWAQLMKAQVLFDMGKIDEAREENLNVLSVPAWRGAPLAQATFQLGLIAEREGDPRKAHGFFQRTYFQYKGHAGGLWAAEAYLASARCLQKMGLEEDRLNTYRAMLFDRYVNELPQAEEARKVLGAVESEEISALIEAGTVTNITIAVKTETLTVESAADKAKASPVQEAAPDADAETPSEDAATEVPLSDTAMNETDLEKEME